MKNGLCYEKITIKHRNTIDSYGIDYTVKQMISSCCLCSSDGPTGSSSTRIWKLVVKSNQNIGNCHGWHNLVIKMLVYECLVIADKEMGAADVLLLINGARLLMKLHFNQWRTRGGQWWSEPPTFSIYDSRNFSKNARTIFKKRVSPYLREFEGRGPKFSRGYVPRPPL